METPEHLSNEARQIWEEITTKYNFEHSAELKILQVSLEAFDRAQEARRAIDLEGLTVKDRFGQVRANPLLSTERENRAAYVSGIKTLNLPNEEEQTKRSVGSPTAYERFQKKGRV